MITHRMPEIYAVASTATVLRDVSLWLRCHCRKRRRAISCGSGSVASLTAAYAMVYGPILSAGVPALPALLALLAMGANIGAINGYLVSYMKISFLVVALGTLSIYQRFAPILHSGTSISVFSMAGFKPLYEFANGTIGPFPIVLILDLALLFLLGGLLKFTGLGRAFYAIGCNHEAARLNGINVPFVIMLVFVIAGLMAGLGALVQVGRLTSAGADVDPTILMTVLAAVLIGGTAFTGGEGGVFGAVIGVLFLGVIQNGLTLSGVLSFWQGMVSGGILIAAVWLGGAPTGAQREVGERIGLGLSNPAGLRLRQWNAVDQCFGEVCLRCGEDVSRLAFLGDFTRPHDDDPVAQVPHYRKVMADEGQCHAHFLLQPLQKIEYLGLG
jgi:ribose/xylose/arabinose/galactoside ABC-type transport system permease subunit